MRSVQKDANNRVSVGWLNGMVTYHPDELVERAEQAYETRFYSCQGRPLPLRQQRLEKSRRH